eukprot:CAMPEP_0194081448 /NCGR_PEP_ID=MMETSP0149-20130528/7218_1 /TAXON_ID=122233 /ORGANISM="Chaetoceros debilis, Strain MM31A-1" /LENGTH=453 /DNA_ID=CAMNT_0038763367 /DNA_START=614 /DNA_END=1975 /DNA_ORIENTATION=+
MKPQDILDRQFTRPLIVKLKPNMPADKAFDFNWGKTYYFEDEIGNQSPQTHLYARDIHHVDFGDGNAGYIICGKVTNGKVLQTDAGSFLLLTDLDGNSKKFMVYSGVKELNSVVPTKGDMNSQGFVAVGTHTKQQGKREYDTAAYLSVNIDLSPRCLSVTAGKWPDTAHSRTSSTFKKIIQYGQDDFAMVGHSSKDLTRCNTKDTDILVSIKDQDCGTIAGYHYGQGTSSDAYNEEFGMSLGEYKLGSGKGLVITGRVKQTKLSCTDSFNPTYEDGFIMRLNNALNLKYFQRFDFDTDYDSGLAIAVYRNRIWVSGETTTSFFIPNSNTRRNRDIFLLEFKKNGSLQNSFTYGGPFADGALGSGLDLEFSQEGFPIILGNSIATSKQKALLIEHYKDAWKNCRGSTSNNPNLEQYAAKKRNNKDKEQETEAEEMSLVAIDVDLNQKLDCPKQT